MKCDKRSHKWKIVIEFCVYDTWRYQCEKCKIYGYMNPGSRHFVNKFIREYPNQEILNPEQWRMDRINEMNCNDTVQIIYPSTMLNGRVAPKDPYSSPKTDIKHRYRENS